jgi:hypothetical protein
MSLTGEKGPLGLNSTNVPTASPKARPNRHPQNRSSIEGELSGSTRIFLGIICRKKMMHGP